MAACWIVVANTKSKIVISKSNASFSHGVHNEDKLGIGNVPTDDNSVAAFNFRLGKTGKGH